VAWHFYYDDYLDSGVISASGIVTSADLAAAIIEASGHPRFHPGARILFDYVRLSGSVNPRDVMFNERHERIFSARSRRAFLVDRANYGGFASLLSARHVAGQVRVFSDRATSVDWLHDGAPPWKKLI
jgi:hypothetical protein